MSAYASDVWLVPLTVDKRGAHAAVFVICASSESGEHLLHSCYSRLLEAEVGSVSTVNVVSCHALP